jgi:hypothetical protein
LAQDGEAGKETRRIGRGEERRTRGRGGERCWGSGVGWGISFDLILTLRLPCGVAWPLTLIGCTSGSKWSRVTTRRLFPWAPLPSHG